ncbi:exosortase S [Arthrobacter sp. HLT1-20]
MTTTPANNSGTASLPAPAGVARRASGSHGFPALVVLLGAGALIMFEVQLRTLEARAFAGVLSVFSDATVYSVGSMVVFRLEDQAPYGLNITALCSTGVLWVPLLVVAGLILLSGRCQRGPLLRALLFSLLIVAACNVGRFLMIVLGLVWWGQAGFDLMHHYLGSIVVIAGFVAAFILLVMSARKSPKQRP